ncbi:MAG: PilZ domain-containing protein [Steroidobacteraceae bacterium]
MPDQQTYEGTDTVVLDDELACHDVLPVVWRPQDPPDPFQQAGLDDNNLQLLQACVAVEEYPQPRDTGEELGPLAAELARLDFKLNLTLQLLGQLVNREALPPAGEVTFNSVGATWVPRQSLSTAIPGSSGILRIQLRSSLPQLLELPAQIVSVKPAEAKVRFTHVSQPVAELLQRLAFLRHRRSVAEGRKSRGL